MSYQGIASPMAGIMGKGDMAISSGRRDWRCSSCCGRVTGGIVPQGTNIYYKQNPLKKFINMHPKKYKIIESILTLIFRCVRVVAYKVLPRLEVATAI